MTQRINPIGPGGRRRSIEIDPESPDRAAQRRAARRALDRLPKSHPVVVTARLDDGSVRSVGTYTASSVRLNIVGNEAAWLARYGIKTSIETKRAISLILTWRG